MLDSILDFFASNYPVLIPWMLSFALAIILFLVAFRTKNATDFSLFWGIIKWERNLAVRTLEKSLEDLSRDSEIKGNVIFLTKLFVKNYNDILNSSNQESIPRLIHQILYSIPQALKSRSQHRIAVLASDIESKNLTILYGLGYSEKAIKQMELPIENSCAGQAYRNGSIYYCEDKRKDRYWINLPEATHSYQSFVCVPITVQGKAIAILNVDAVEPEAFSEDDIANLKLFSGLLGILLWFQISFISNREVAINDGLSGDGLSGERT